MTVIILQILFIEFVFVVGFDVMTWEKGRRFMLFADTMAWLIVAIFLPLFFFMPERMIRFIDKFTFCDRIGKR